MTKEEIFQIWAPDDSPWSPWVKPVLFAHLGLAAEPFEIAAPDVSWTPAVSDRVALVVNLPGPEGVVTGAAVALQGYRPVPLYNALPLPWGESIHRSNPGRAVAAVDTLPILRALASSTRALAEAKLPCDAPPAFLLDYNRQGDGRKPGPGQFDNRSISFTTDFPSVIFLGAHGVHRSLLIQKEGIQPDLAHTLRRWQDGGMKLERLRPDDGVAESFDAPKPSWYGVMFQRVLLQLGFHRSGAGGFGGWIPDSPGGG